MAPRPVAVVIGVGGIGAAVARRIANGRRLLLADHLDQSLETNAAALRRDGFEVETHKVDVSNYESVVAFAQAVAKAGRAEAVVHTAALTGTQAGADRILEVDLLGTANVLDAFYDIASPGMSMICVSSLGGHAYAPFAAELEKHLATAPRHELLTHPELKPADSLHAYAISKRGNQLRVQADAKAWGLKGARVNTISPGVISTALTQEEFAGGPAEFMRGLISQSAAKRMGTPEEVASVAAFLVSSESSYVTGVDILVDGGALAGQRWRK